MKAGGGSYDTHRPTRTPNKPQRGEEAHLVGGAVVGAPGLADGVALEAGDEALDEVPGGLVVQEVAAGQLRQELEVLRAPVVTL